MTKVILDSNLNTSEKSQTVDWVLAEQLQGYPKQFEKSFIPALKLLVSHGIAAEVDDGFMRGYKFHDIIK